MEIVEIPLMTERFEKNSNEFRILTDALAYRAAATQLIAEERYMDAMERTVTALKTLREFRLRQCGIPCPPCNPAVRPLGDSFRLEKL